MEVRPWNERRDVRAIARINVRAWRAAYDGILPESVLEELDPDPTDAELRERREGYRTDSGVLLVATVDGTVRGYGFFRWGAETKDFVEDTEAGLTAIYVDPDAWGEGVGTALLEAGLERLPDAVDRLKLEMLAGNDVGDRFYEARGFERVGSGEYEIDGETYPTVVYALEV